MNTGFYQINHILFGLSQYSQDTIAKSFSVKTHVSLGTKIIIPNSQETRKTRSFKKEEHAKGKLTSRSSVWHIVT